MILIIRGHIRNSFDNKDLYHLVKKINDIVDNLIIYIHTWNIYANNVSWREREENNTQVTKELIKEYFGDLNIVDIIIDDDKKIELIGNTKGNIYNGKMPIIGWKNYWYGKYKIIKHIHEKITGTTTYIKKEIIGIKHDKIINYSDYGGWDEILDNSEIILNIYDIPVTNIKTIINYLMGINPDYIFICCKNKNISDIKFS